MDLGEPTAFDISLLRIYDDRTVGFSMMYPLQVSNVAMSHPANVFLHLSYHFPYPSFFTASLTIVRGTQ
jgi:hypothetical protein